MHSRISRAFPIALPSGCSMSVITTTIFVFIARHTSTIDRESAFAVSRVDMNAPEPVFTSMTRKAPWIFAGGVVDTSTEAGSSRPSAAAVSRSRARSIAASSIAPDGTLAVG